MQIHTAWVCIFLCIVVQATAFICSYDSDCRTAKTCKATCNTRTGVCNLTASTLVCPQQTECEPLSGTCVQCLTDDQCPSATPYCTRSYTCSQCNKDTQCRSYLDCNATCVNGVCKSGSLRCTGLNPTCQISLGTCATECADITDPTCSALRPLTPHCSVDKTCVQCSSHSHCQTEEDCGATCDFETGTCVSSSDLSNNCRKQGMRCHPEGLCVECVISTDCDFGKKCSQEAGFRCMNATVDPCTDSFDCSRDDICNRVCINATCVLPASTAATNCLSKGQRCSGLGGKCVDCTSDEHCGNPAKPYCQLFPDEPGFLTCVACTSDVDHCDVISCGSTCNTGTHTCGGGIGPCIDPLACGSFSGSFLCLDTCESDKDCTADPKNSRCDPESSVCVQCLFDEECQDLLADCNARCNLTSGKCSSTSNSVTCPTNRYCNPLPLLSSFTQTDIPQCVECQRDGHCTDPRFPICSESSFTCVRCTSSADCRKDDNCDAVCQNNKCVEMSTNINCSASGKVCNQIAGTCVQCNSNALCSLANPARPFCDNFGNCVACSQHTDCRSDQACSGWCRSDGVCQYPTSSDCTATRSTCNINTGKCVQCHNDTQCSGATPACDTNTGRCIECTSAIHCANDTNCRSMCLNGKCTRGDLNCATSKQFCANVNGDYDCLNCRKDADCSNAAAPICLIPLTVSDAQCVQCTEDSHCRSNNDCSSTCNMAAYTCVRSSSPLTCNKTGSSTKACDATAGRCIECNSNTDCPTTTPFCFSGVCHECSKGFMTNSDADCRSDSNCDAECIWSTQRNRNVCAKTSSPKNCASENMKCDTRSGECIECAVNSDCSGTPTTPFCSPQGYCVECLGDDTCETNTSCSSTCRLDFTCTRGVDCSAFNGLCRNGVCYAPDSAPMDCAYGAWQVLSCKCGVQTLTRKILSPALNGGADCDPSLTTMTSTCNNTCSDGDSDASGASYVNLSFNSVFIMVVVSLFVNYFKY